jgi:cobyric acid synthase
MPLVPIKGWTIQTSKSTGKEYYACKSLNKSIYETPTEECPASTATAAAAAPAPATKKNMNVTVLTPNGEKKFTVIAKGGKYKKTRKNKLKKK